MAEIIYTGDAINLTPNIGNGYTVQWSFTAEGKTSYKTVATNQNGTYKFVPTAAVFGPLMPESSTGSLTVICIRNNVKRTYHYVLKINDSVKPEIASINLGYHNAFNGKKIKGITTADALITLKGLYGATQFVRVLNSAGKEIVYKVVDAVSDDSSIKISCYLRGLTEDPSTFKITVNDSRGNTHSQTINISDIYNYVKPSATASMTWDDKNQPSISYEATIQELIGGSANSLKSVTVSYIDSTGASLSKQFTDANKSNEPLEGTFDDAGSYTFIVLVEDQISTGQCSVTLDGSKPIIDIGADGNTIVIFGKAPNQADVKSVQIYNESNNFNIEIGSNGLVMYNKTRVPFMEMGIQKNDDNSEPFYNLGLRDTSKIPGYLSMTGGSKCAATGVNSHAEGYYTEASGFNSYAGGENSISSGEASFTHGYGTNAVCLGQAVVGMYNKLDDNSVHKYAFIVGNGSSDSNRNNALAVCTDGDLEINNKSVNSVIAGTIMHAYGNGASQSTGTNRDAYTALKYFVNKSNGRLKDLITVNDSSQDSFTFNKAGVYNIQARVSYSCSTQYKRFELVPFINGSRVARLSSSYITTINGGTLVDIANYTIEASAGDTFSLKVNSIDSVAINVNANDITITALDYEGKYK